MSKFTFCYRKFNIIKSKIKTYAFASLNDKEFMNSHPILYTDRIYINRRITWIFLDI